MKKFSFHTAIYFRHSTFQKYMILFILHIFFTSVRPKALDLAGHIL